MSSPEYIETMLANAYEIAWMDPDQTEAGAGVFVAQYMYDLGRSDERRPRFDTRSGVYISGPKGPAVEEWPGRYAARWAEHSRGLMNGAEP